MKQLLKSLTAFGGRISIGRIDKKYTRGTFAFTTEVNGATGEAEAVTVGEFYVQRR